MWQFLSAETELPWDPAVPPQGTYSKDLEAGTCTETCTETRTPLFVAALSTIAKWWTQCESPLVDTGQQDLYTAECHPALKTYEILTPAAMWVDLVTVN